jgi:hypothetical protein
MLSSRLSVFFVMKKYPSLGVRNRATKETSNGNASQHRHHGMDCNRIGHNSNASAARAVRRLIPRAGAHTKGPWSHETLPCCIRHFYFGMRISLFLDERMRWRSLRGFTLNPGGRSRHSAFQMSIQGRNPTCRFSRNPVRARPF